MGLLDFLSPALTVATEAAGAYQGAEANAAAEKRQQTLQALTMAKQAHDDQIKNALSQSRQKYYDARADATLNPPEKPHKYTLVPSQGPDGQGRYVKLDETTGDVSPTDAGLKPPAPTKDPTAHFSVTPITAADGTVHLARVNTLTGEVQDTGVLGKQPTAPTQHSGLAAVSDARLATAAQQATDADTQMTQFEQALSAGHTQIPTAGIILAKRALQPDAMGSSIAETMLNEQYPDLARYVRAAKAVASAERLISPRGGSNALMQAEATLSAAGAHASPQIIAQAQAYRKALVHGLAGHGASQTPAPAGRASTAGAAPKQSITAQEAAALKQLGHSDADIAAHYTVTGGGQ